MGRRGYFAPQNGRQAFFFWVLFPALAGASLLWFVIGDGTRPRLLLGALLSGGAAAVSAVSALRARQRSR